MFKAFLPSIIKDPFKSNILCWRQGKNNSILNNALVKFKEKLGEVTQSKGEAYTFEDAEICSVRVDPHSTAPLPSGEALEKALISYAWNAGDVLTFVSELPMILLKINLIWGKMYKQTFPTPNGYHTSLQPILES